MSQEELIKKFAKEIRSDKKFERFFKDYTPSSVKSFVELYALKKAMWIMHGPLYKNEIETREMQWVNAAMERLDEIQQVKLFLFQCRYRAAPQEPVEGVNTIFDFMYWRHNVLNAPFLEPVSEDDVELYCRYMEEFDYNHLPMGFLEDWQDFDAIREAYQNEGEAGRDLPEWYRFYFSRTGRGAELLLPDLKKEKDIFYFLKGNEERIRLLQEEERKRVMKDPAAVPEKGEYFNEFVGNNLERFMNLFEDKDNRRMHEEYKLWCSYHEKEELLREDLDLLLAVEENVPVEANEDWQEALHLAAARHRSKKIAENIYAAFDEYKMNLGLGIRFPEKEDSRSQSDFYNNLVLLGRKLMGEKEDFDY